MIKGDWRLNAACIGLDGLMFDPERRFKAVSICQSCPVVEPCRNFALTDRMIRQIHRSTVKLSYGVIGGLTPAELRTALRARRSRVRRSA